MLPFRSVQPWAWGGPGSHRGQGKCPWRISTPKAGPLLPGRAPLGCFKAHRGKSPQHWWWCRTHSPGYTRHLGRSCHQPARQDPNNPGAPFTKFLGCLQWFTPPQRPAFDPGRGAGWALGPLIRETAPVFSLPRNPLALSSQPSMNTKQVIPSTSSFCSSGGHQCWEHNRVDTSQLSLGPLL